MVRRFFPAKSLRFGATGGGACGYLIPVGGAFGGTLAILGLRMTTLDHLGLDDALRRYPLRGV